MCLYFIISGLAVKQVQTLTHLQGDAKIHSMLEVCQDGLFPLFYLETALDEGLLVSGIGIGPGLVSVTAEQITQERSIRSYGLHYSAEGALIEAAEDFTEEGLVPRGVCHRRSLISDHLPKARGELTKALLAGESFSCLRDDEGKTILIRTLFEEKKISHGGTLLQVLDNAYPGTRILVLEFFLNHSKHTNVNKTALILQQN